MANMLLFATILYNPMSLVAAGRLIEIDKATKHAHIVCMPGTRLRCNGDYKCNDVKLKHHIAYNFGYKPGAFTNKSAGVTVLLRKDWFKSKHLRAVTLPPVALAGRGGAIRVKSGRFDLHIVIGYQAPRPQEAKKIPAWEKGTKQLQEWVRKTVANTPARCTPVVFTDLNDGLEKTEDEQQMARTEKTDTAVGTFCNSHQGLAGELFHNMMTEQHLFAVTTIKDIGASYIGPTGHESNIDQIAFPIGMKEGIQEIAADRALGKRLQMIHSPHSRDHIPIRSSFYYNLNFAHDSETKDKKVHWSTDDIAMCYQRGEKRLELIENVEKAVEGYAGDWSELEERNTVDKHWTEIVDVIKDAAGEIWAKGKEVPADVKYFKDLQGVLLKERFKLREDVERCKR